MERINLNVDSNNKQILSKIAGKTNYLDGHMQWTLRFSDPLDIRTINSKNVYVKDSKEYKYDMIYVYDEESNNLTITPKGEYIPNENYFLVLTTRVKSKNGRFLRNELVIQFAQQVIEDIPRAKAVSVKKEGKAEEATEGEEAKKENKGLGMLLFSEDKVKASEEKHENRNVLIEKAKEPKTPKEKYGIERLKQFEQEVVRDREKNNRKF